jgi:predicted fused transcriptional regulator/phosphomethylpyrimidine kinase
MRKAAATPRLITKPDVQTVEGRLLLIKRRRAALLAPVFFLPRWVALLAVALVI